MIVWKLDRLGRNLYDLIIVLDDLKARGIKFRSLTKNIETETPTGRAMWQMIGILAELERSQIKERTQAGIAAAKARGVQFGRKKKLRPYQVQQIRKRIESGEAPSDDSEPSWWYYSRGLTHVSMELLDKASTDFGEAIRYDALAPSPRPDWSQIMDQALYYLASKDDARSTQLYSGVIAADGVPVEDLAMAIRDLDEFLEVFPHNTSGLRSRQLMSEKLAAVRNFS